MEPMSRGMDMGGGPVRNRFFFSFVASFLPSQVELLKKMQSIIYMRFSEFLRMHFSCLRGVEYSSKNVVKCALEAVKLGLLDKDCMRMNDDSDDGGNKGNYCLVVALLEHAFCDQKACMPFLQELFTMKPCLRKVLADLSLYYRWNDRFMHFCMSFDYFWSDLLLEQYWWAMPVDVHDKWSPCRVAWIWAVVQ